MDIMRFFRKNKFMIISSLTLLLLLGVGLYMFTKFIQVDSRLDLMQKSLRQLATQTKSQVPVSIPVAQSQTISAIKEPIQVQFDKALEELKEEDLTDVELPKAISKVVPKVLDTIPEETEEDMSYESSDDDLEALQRQLEESDEEESEIVEVEEEVSEIVEVEEESDDESFEELDFDFDMDVDIEEEEVEVELISEVSEELDFEISEEEVEVVEEEEEEKKCEYVFKRGKNKGSVCEKIRCNKH